MGQDLVHSYYTKYNIIWECIVVVYKHFDRSLHVKSSDPTYVENFRPVPLTETETEEEWPTISVVQL